MSEKMHNLSTELLIDNGLVEFSEAEAQFYIITGSLACF
jgi:hypothetical protein